MKYIRPLILKFDDFHDETMETKTTIPEKPSNEGKNDNIFTHEGNPNITVSLENATPIPMKNTKLIVLKVNAAQYATFIEEWYMLTEWL